MRKNDFLTLCRSLVCSMLAVSCFFLVGCSNQEIPFETDSVTKSPEEKRIMQKRSFEEALEIAQQTIGAFSSSNARAETSQRKISLADTKFVIKNPTARNGEGQDTLMYIFNFEDNQGFSVISANKATEPLIAQTEAGTYDENTEVENPAFGMYMDMAEQYVSNTVTPIDTTLATIKEYRMFRDTIETVRIAPKVALRWGQTGCEATYTTNGYSGCSNTAMAQIMSYFNYPSQIAITYPNATISSLNLNWNDIKMHNVSHSIQICNASDDTHEAIGHLLRQLGHLNNSDYRIDETGKGAGTWTYDSDVNATFLSLGYTTSNIIGYSGESLYSILANDKLLFMSGCRMETDNTYVGHAWLADGYLQYKITTRECTRDYGSLEWEILTEYEPYYVGYYHFNWGWDGGCNGYFMTDVFATNKAFEYDNTSSGFYNATDRDYKYYVSYFYVTK